MNAQEPDTQETRQSLWLLTVSPIIWSLHFLISYTTAAIWIEKVGGRDASLGLVRTLIGIYTVIALGGILGMMLIGYRRHRYGSGTTPHDFDTAADRHRFLGFATVLLSGLSAVGTIFSAMVVIFIETSH